MRNLINKILENMANVCKAQRKFVSEMLVAIMCTRGKINFRNLSRYTNYSEKTISRQFNKPFNFAEFNGLLIAEATNTTATKIAGYDQSFIAKSGKKTYGVEYFWNGCASRVEKGLEIGTLGVIDLEANTGYAISARQTPPLTETKNDPQHIDNSRVNFYVKHINDDARYLPPTVQHIVVDGFFYKDKFVEGITKECGLHVIGKARHDAHFCYVYKGTQKQRGRHKKRGEKVDFKNLNYFEWLGKMKDEEAYLYSATLYSVALKCFVKVLVLVPNDPKKQHVLFYSTDLDLPPLDILRYYRARFQIEFVFRDSKEFAGLCDCQARTKEKLHWHFNISLAALNFAKIQDRLGKKSVRSVFSMASWKARYFNEKLMSLIFSAFGLDLNKLKNLPVFEELINLGVISC